MDELDPRPSHHHSKGRHPSRDVTDSSLGPSIAFVSYTQELLLRLVTSTLASSLLYDHASLLPPQHLAQGFINVSPSTLALDRDKGLVFFGPLRPNEDSGIHVQLWSPLYFRRQELARSTLAWGMQHWNLHRLYANIPSRNRLACRYIESLGFQLEGVLREHFRYTEGRDDGRVYALLREEAE